MTFLFVLLLAVQVIWVANGVSIRILEGVDRKSDKDESTIPYVEPSSFSGPEALSFLSGSCFTNSFDRYEYTICPFQNVTQRRTTAVKPILIGLWGHWQTTSSRLHTEKIGVEKDKRKIKTGEVAAQEIPPIVPAHPVDPNVWYYNLMEYPNGRNCGVDGDSVTMVYLQCEHSSFEIISLDSEATCAFTLTLGLPISCDLLRVVRNA